jgi:hypothetical protein
MMALATGIIVALLWQPAIADELVAPRWSGQLLDPHRYELRFGGFAHGVGSIESGQIDINGEFVLPRLPFGRGEWWDFLVPRPHLGVMANLSGGTSYAYAGGLWTIPLPSRFFVEFFSAGRLPTGRRPATRRTWLWAAIHCFMSAVRSATASPRTGTSSLPSITYPTETVFSGRIAIATKASITTAPVSATHFEHYQRTQFAGAETSAYAEEASMMFPRICGRG